MLDSLASTVFVPGRDQDAAATIRGFRYQIHVTILRWMELQGEDVLFLECGEDIDRVFKGQDKEPRRDLEQVKDVKRSITLRSPDALRSLANFASHVEANPGASLRLRFTTTAQVGQERPAAAGVNGPAIEAWKALQAKPEWSAADEATASGLLSALWHGLPIFRGTWHTHAEPCHSVARGTNQKRPSYAQNSRPRGGIGRRSGLKIRRPERGV